jgi:hypothetical protein
MDFRKIFFLIIPILFLIVPAESRGENNLKVAKVYFLPDFLQGRITDEWYNRWLTRKAKYLIAQDREKHRPCARNATAQQYKELIHAAVQSNGLFDPFTGDTLQWELVCTWVDTKKKNPDPGLMKRYSLLPTVDHVDPYAGVPAFEICSWLVNRCKNNLTPPEFIALADKIAKYRKSKQSFSHHAEGPAKTVYGSPQKYFPPDVLSGIMTEQAYPKWLTRKAKHIYYADVKEKRPCSDNATAMQYKELIHAAIHAAGNVDPFTGDPFSWELLGTWDDALDKDPDQALIRKFGTLPTVDHVDPFGARPEFEICSWIINRCKANQTPAEFVALCEKVVAHSGAH